MSSRNQGLPSNVLQIAHGSWRARMDISEQLGIPNCFVCRGDSENIVPLEKNVLKAIMPYGHKKPSFATRAWICLCKGILSDLTLSRHYLFTLEARNVTIRYENGVENSVRTPSGRAVLSQTDKLKTCRAVRVVFCSVVVDRRCVVWTL